MFADCLAILNFLHKLQVKMSLLTHPQKFIHTIFYMSVITLSQTSKFYILKNKLSHPIVKAVFSSPLGNKQLQVVSVTQVASYTHIMITTLILSFASDLCNNIDIILIPGL